MILNGAELKAELVRLGLTQRKVAERMGYTHTYLSKLINGREQWSRQSARSFSMASGIPLEAIIDVEPEAALA